MERTRSEEKKEREKKGGLVGDVMVMVVDGEKTENGERKEREKRRVCGRGMGGSEGYGVVGNGVILCGEEGDWLYTSKVCCEEEE